MKSTNFLITSLFFHFIFHHILRFLPSNSWKLVGPSHVISDCLVGSAVPEEMLLLWLCDARNDQGHLNHSWGLPIFFGGGLPVRAMLGRSYDNRD